MAFTGFNNHNNPVKIVVHTLASFYPFISCYALLFPAPQSLEAGGITLVMVVEWYYCKSLARGVLPLEAYGVHVDSFFFLLLASNQGLSYTFANILLHLYPFFIGL